MTLYLVAAKNERGVSTAECYREYDRTGGGKAADNRELIEGLRTGDLYKIARNCQNDLEAAAMTLRPDIAAVRAHLEKEKPPAVFMTGSGSAVAALCESKEQADCIADKIKDKVFWSGSFETVPQGIKIEQ
jgi:4-diphosphocytidyl-2-C-methyl-D-erythritol kinase